MRHLAIASALAAGALAIYSPVIGFGIVNYDDDVYLAAPQLAEGISAANLAWAFTTFYHSNWHPLTWLSWLAEIELFGSRPGLMHLGNALLHAANGALLYAALLRLTRKALPSGLAAALLVAHPMHVESVAWISERKDVLSMFFGLCALVAWADYARQPRRATYLAAAAAFVLSLLAKPTLVTFPFVLLLLDYWPLARHRESRLLLEKAPFFALSAASCVLTWLAQSSGGALREIPLAERLAHSATAYVGYLAKTFVPVNLAVLYPRPVQGPDWFDSGLAAAGVALISWNAWVYRRRLPYFAVGWAWFAGALVPVIGIVQLGEHAMADRYAYWPHVGLFVALAFGLDALVSGWRSRPLRVAAAGACAVWVVALALLAHAQTFVWKDSETLWRHALDVTRDNYVAHANLGRTLQASDPAQAQLHFGAALAINPDAFRPVDASGRPLEAPGAQSDR